MKKSILRCVIFQRASGASRRNGAAIFYGCCLLACSADELILSVKDVDSYGGFRNGRSGAPSEQQWRAVGNGRVRDREKVHQSVLAILYSALDGVDGFDEAPAV